MDDIFEMIAEGRRAGQCRVLVTLVERKGHVPAPLQSHMLVGESGRLAGTVGGGALEAEALTTAASVLENGEGLLREFVLEEDSATDTPMLCGGRATLFFEYIAGPAQVFLFGAGHLGQALAEILGMLGFALTFIDSRPEYLEQAGSRIQGARLLEAGAEYREFPDISNLEDSYVLIATHSHAHDETILEWILEKMDEAQPGYLGIIASRKKQQYIFSRVQDKLALKSMPDWLYTPAGLRLGGASPAEIALSVAAEIQVVRKGMTGHKHMRG